MGWRRARRIGLIVVACLVVVGVLFLWALPEIVRRVALDQIPKRTGRAASIEKVELNLFTGRFALHKFRLAEREGPEAFVEIEDLSLRLATLPLLRSQLVVREIALTAPSARIVRIGPGQFNFSDLLEPSGKPTEPRQPSRWTTTVERVRVSRATVRVEDRAVSPLAQWMIRDVDVDGGGITTRAGEAPGRLDVRARINEAGFGVKAEFLRLDPVGVHAKISLTGFELRQLVPYVFAPRGTPYQPTGGRLGVALGLQVDSDVTEVKKARLSGTVTLEGPALTQVGRPDAFFKVSRLAIDISDADALARSLTVGTVAIEGLDVKARRDAHGVIDLLDLLKAKALPAESATSGAATSAAPSAPVAAPPAAAPGAPAGPRTLAAVVGALQGGFEKIRIERISMTPSTAMLLDEGVTPPTTLALTNLEAQVHGVTWPVTGPATLVLSTRLPGGGTLEIKGPVVAQPFDADLAFTLRNAPVEPYQAYLGVPARLSGRFSGDSRNHIAFRDGATVLASKGNSWAENVEIRAPGGTRPIVRVERMDLVGIDFDWPRHAAVAKASFRKPRAEVERAADGTINIRSAFTSPQAASPSPTPAAPTREAAAPSRPTAGAEKPKSLLETIRLEFKEVRIEDGFVRFLDRTTKPAFSEDLSRLDVAITGLTNRPGRRAHLVLKSAVGGDAALDIRGDIAPLGAAPFADLVGELHRFKLASVDPYAASAIGWVVKRGELQYKLALKLEGDALTMSNDVLVGQLQVAPGSATDEVKQRIGLPLGLIVALIKDGKGDIHFAVPVTGSLKDPKFDMRDAIWTAVRNVLVNVVKAPFRAISRLFSPGEKLEEPKVDPVTFAAGSAVLSPEMEEHLVRVGDFLRRSPFMSLGLTPTTSPADAQALRREAVTARIRELQKEQGITEAPAAIAAYFKKRLPDAPPPKTTEEQLAVLEARETVPDSLLADLDRRRAQATRERLVATEGIQPERVAVAEARPAPAAAAPAAGEGRVEFTLAGRE